MCTIYFDSQHSESIRRENIFCGDIYVFSARRSTRAFVDFARKSAIEAFAPFDPCDAQHHMPAEKFAAILSELKPRFMHDPKVKEQLRAIFEDFGEDPEQVFFDVPRMRTMTHGNYLRTGIALAVPPHRDTWYAGHQAQLNWWFPVCGVAPENTMVFHPGYFDRGVRNVSDCYDHNQWIDKSRAEASQHIKSDTRQHPEIRQEIDTSADIRIHCEEGGLLLFSASHLHSTGPNTSGHTRFSVDFRTVNLEDVLSGRGAPNIDNNSAGTTLGEYMRVSDFAPIAESVVASQ
jgi:hypothetical protein